jgi:hypothetical protein
MLAYLLALAVGFGSFVLYLSAFLFPEISRKYDLTWSGVGLFYALVLWVCAGRITGGVLVGQMASTALLGWFVWQTLSLRLAQASPSQRSHLPDSVISFQDWVQYRWQQLQQHIEDGSWRVYVSGILEQLPDQVADLLKMVQGWLEALISTSLKPQELSISAPTSAAEDRALGDRPTPNSIERVTSAIDQLDEALEEFSNPSDSSELTATPLSASTSTAGERGAGEALPFQPSQAQHDPSAPIYQWISRVKQQIQRIVAAAEGKTAVSLDDSQFEVKPQAVIEPDAAATPDAAKHEMKGHEVKKREMRRKTKESGSASTDPLTELAAEWDDLEPEIHPELETMDGGSLGLETPLQQASETQSKLVDLPGDPPRPACSEDN